MLGRSLRTSSRAHPNATTRLRLTVAGRLVLFFVLNFQATYFRDPFLYMSLGAAGLRSSPFGLWETISRLRGSRHCRNGDGQFHLDVNLSIVPF